MKAVSYRLDEDIIALVKSLAVRGFGSSSADVVRKAVCFMAASDPGAVAKAWVDWIASIPEPQAVPAVVVIGVEPEPAATVIPEKTCTICECPLDGESDSFCDLHTPDSRDSF